MDDAAIEAPGTCHLENWISAGTDGAALLNLGPACTTPALPNIELGGFLTHQWHDNAAETDGGLGLKLRLRNEERGWGLALSTAAGFSAKRSRMESASVIVPLTFPVSNALRINVNAGWQWTRIERHSLFTGGQAEIALGPRLGLMIEGFTRSKGKAGGQGGVRWTIDHKRIDVDLLMGHMPTAQRATPSPWASRSGVKASSYRIPPAPGIISRRGSPRSPPSRHSCRPCRRHG
ncbi:MAG TPA: hypothetical protein VF509_01165 [Sphingobium sp.]